MKLRAMPGRGRFAIFAAAVMFVAVAAGPATAQDAVTPAEEFSAKIEQLKKTFTDLNKRISERAKSIDQEPGPLAARREIEELRAIVGVLLGAVADNGEVARLGQKALGHARDKLKALRGDTRFTREQRDFLVGEWDRLAKETERATEELDAARTRFAGLLRTLQTNDDYVGELLEIRQGEQALKIVRDLAKEIREATDLLNNFINAIAPPKPGT